MADDVRSQRVSLGCGTLILIALIVLIFGGRGTTDLEREVHTMRAEIGELRKSVVAYFRCTAGNANHSDNGHT